MSTCEYTVICNRPTTHLCSKDLSKVKTIEKEEKQEFDKVDDCVIKGLSFICNTSEFKL